MEFVMELELDEAVRFLGEREEVPDILRACDIALLPSWDEPFGRTIAEAMAMGVPMVATWSAARLRSSATGSTESWSRQDSRTGWRLRSPGCSTTRHGVARSARLRAQHR